MAKIMLKPRLRCSGSRIDRRRTSSVGKRAVASVDAEAAAKLGQLFPQTDKQRGHDGRINRPTPRLPSRLGRVGPSPTSSEGPRAVGSSEAEPF